MIEGSNLFLVFTDSGTIESGQERAVYDLLEAYPYTLDGVQLRTLL